MGKADNFVQPSEYCQVLCRVKYNTNVSPKKKKPQTNRVVGQKEGPMNIRFYPIIESHGKMQSQADISI